MSYIVQGVKCQTLDSIGWFSTIYLI